MGYKICIAGRAHAYNPSTLGGRSGWITRSRDQDHPGQHGETTSLLKTQKISWTRWRMPVIPATQEPEAGELLRTWEVKVAVNLGCVIALQPGRQSKTYLKTNKQKTKTNKKTWLKIGITQGAFTILRTGQPRPTDSLVRGCLDFSIFLKGPYVTLMCTQR